MTRIIKKYIPALLIAAAPLLSSCDDKLDLIPKGQTTLSNLDDLELLLNQKFDLGVTPYSEITMLCNESVHPFYSVPQVIATKNSLDCANLTYDTSIDRVTLAQSDARYSDAYKYINYFNTILDKIDPLEGGEERKTEIKAKARILRAYFHWLLVSIHAKQYDEAIAEKEGGIAYVTDIEVTKTKEKLSLADTYRAILDDCTDDVILALPVENTNVCQADRAFGYAVRAKVLFQMKDYEAALPYYQKALEINGVIEDRSYIKETEDWALTQSARNHMLYVGAGVNVSPFMEILSLESVAKFEKNDYVMKYTGWNGWDFEYGPMYSGMDGTPMFFGMSACVNSYGISTDPLYYDLAECLIRTGQIREGLAMADKVRKMHIENPTPFTMAYDLMKFDEKTAMELMQPAKWIENVGSCWNYFDTKRWNSEEKYKKTITRDLKEYGVYELAPDSPLWVVPFPGSATRYNETLTQNF